MAQHTLENSITGVARDDRVSLQDAAKIIERHKRCSEASARKALIGALAQQRMEAYSDRAWYWVHDDPAGPDFEGVIPPSLWVLAHAIHCDHPATRSTAPSADTMNWETGEMRKWRWSVVAELPFEARKLVPNRGNYDLVHWEFIAQKTTVTADDLLRVANEPPLLTYGRWLERQPSLKRGRQENETWERAKARLIAFAAISNPETINALASKEGIKAYLRDSYDHLSQAGKNLDGRDADRFANLIWEQLLLARDSLGPP
jgi:hypothetical protein